MVLGYGVALSYCSMYGVAVWYCSLALQYCVLKSCKGTSTVRSGNIYIYLEYIYNIPGIYYVYFERSEFLIATSKKKKMCASVRLILVLVGKKSVRVFAKILFWCYDSMIPGTYYLPDTYITGISRHKSIRTYVMFRPWTHTSDDSYIYQLSLVVATATVSYIYIMCIVYI